MNEEEYKKEILKIENEYFKSRNLPPNFKDKVLLEYGVCKVKLLKETGKYDARLLRLAKEMLKDKV
jgi:hypothetical protein